MRSSGYNRGTACECGKTGDKQNMPQLITQYSRREIVNLYDVFRFAHTMNRPLMPTLSICMLFCMIIWSAVLWHSPTEPSQGRNENLLCRFVIFAFVLAHSIFMLIVSFSFFFFFILFVRLYLFSLLACIVTTVALAPEHSLANSNTHTLVLADLVIAS